MMHKHIRSVFLLNETVAFIAAKPLYSTIGHDNILLSQIFQLRLLEDATVENGVLLRNETVSHMTRDAVDVIYYNL